MIIYYNLLYVERIGRRKPDVGRLLRHNNYRPFSNIKIHEDASEIIMNVVFCPFDCVRIYMFYV